MSSKKLIKILIISFVCVAFFSFLILPNITFGQSWKTELEKAKGTLPGGGEETIEATIRTVIQVALSFVGVIFLILMVYGGYLWMLARGNEQQVEKAKKLIEAALIGLVIVMSAYAISVFVLERVMSGEREITECPAGQSACFCPSNCPSVDGTCMPSEECAEACNIAGCLE